MDNCGELFKGLGECICSCITKIHEGSFAAKINQFCSSHLNCCPKCQFCGSSFNGFKENILKICCCGFNKDCFMCIFGDRNSLLKYQNIFFRM